MSSKVTKLRNDELEELKADISKAVEEIDTLKSDRQGINQEKSAIVEKLEAKGISRHALAMAMKYANWDEDQRRGFDLAYRIVRDAIGLPMQRDLFEERLPEVVTEGEAEAAA